MKVYYNNQELEVVEGSTLQDILSKMEAIEHKAVWLNGEHISLSAFDTEVKENDRLTVVRIRGGG